MEVCLRPSFVSLATNSLTNWISHRERSLPLIFSIICGIILKGVSNPDYILAQETE